MRKVQFKMHLKHSSSRSVKVPIKAKIFRENEGHPWPFEIICNNKMLSKISNLFLLFKFLLKLQFHGKQSQLAAVSLYFHRIFPRCSL